MSTLWIVCVVVLLPLLVASAGADALFEVFHVVKKPQGTHGYRGIMGDFVQLGDGSLLMCYTDGDIVAIRSADRGETWSDPVVIAPRPRPPAKGYICHPSFLRLPDGNLMLSYIHSTHPATPYFAQNYYRLSSDDGQSWSEQFCFTPHRGYTLVHNDRLQILSTGRIVAAAEHKAYLPDTQDHSGYVGLTFFSDDGGVTWQASRNTVDLYDESRIEVQEADCVELRDGRLLMVARSYSGFPVFAYSEDKGETWGPPVTRPDISMPYAGMPTIRRIPSTGDLLFIWISERSQDPDNPRVARRCALTAAISRDEGETFIHQRHIARDPLNDFGYQCVEFLDHDVVLVGYHTREGINVARIGVDWFYEQ